MNIILIKGFYLKLEKVLKRKVKNVTFSLDNDALKELDNISKKSKRSKSSVIRDMLLMFGDVYIGAIKTMDKYSDSNSSMALNEYLKQKGYGFLVDGKCKNN